VLLMTTAGHKTCMRWRHPNHGRLVVPRCWDRMAETSSEGIVWGMDNDCFNGFNRRSWLRMMLSLVGLPGCVFVSAPDVVADHDATLGLWHEWQPQIFMTGFPAAFVIQDGATIHNVPWETTEAIFIGGTTEYKLGDAAAEIATEANRRELWVHMGRVNSYRRIRYAQSIGCDSVDGTMWAKFRDTYMANGLTAVSSGTQLRLEAT